MWVSIQTFIEFQAIQHLLSKLGSSTCIQNKTLQRFALKPLKENTDGALSNLSKVFFLEFIHGWDDNYDFYKNKVLPICVRIEIPKNIELLNVTLDAHNNAIFSLLIVKRSMQCLKFGSDWKYDSVGL